MSNPSEFMDDNVKSFRFKCNDLDSLGFDFPCSICIHRDEGDDNSCRMCKGYGNWYKPTSQAIDLEKIKAFITAEVNK